MKFLEIFKRSINLKEIAEKFFKNYNAEDISIQKNLITIKCKNNLGGNSNITFYVNDKKEITADAEHYYIKNSIDYIKIRKYMDVQQLEEHLNRHLN